MRPHFSWRLGSRGGSSFEFVTWVLLIVLLIPVLKLLVYEGLYRPAFYSSEQIVAQDQSETRLEKERRRLNLRPPVWVTVQKDWWIATLCGLPLICALLIARQLKYRRRCEGRIYQVPVCPKCNYNVSWCKDRCSECGHPLGRACAAPVRAPISDWPRESSAGGDSISNRQVPNR
jgi:hypothetical protein